MERVIAHVPPALQADIQLVHHADANVAELLEVFYQQAGSFSAVRFICDQWNEFCIYMSATGCVVVSFLD